MGLSNKFGNLVLSTGNKSELAVGYCTLYGDMVGGFAVLKDVYKTIVFELAKYRNSLSDTPVIPERVITRPPSAELRPDQKIRTHYLLMIFWMQSCMPILKKIKVRPILLPKVLIKQLLKKSFVL
jgi:NAD+ synthetase